MVVGRPAALFDRVSEWDDLVHFAIDPTQSFRIGVVSGRRRQGKSFILDAVARQVGGFYHQALEEEPAPALERLGAAIAADRGLPGGSVSFPDWSALLRALAEPATPAQIQRPRSFPPSAAVAAACPSGGTWQSTPPHAWRGNGRDPPTAMLPPCHAAS